MSFFYYLFISPITNILEVCFKIIQEIFGSNGFAIITLSAIVTVFCLPLYVVAESWSQIERNIQKKMKPGIDRIKKTFKGDEQYMMLSTFYKQNHYHPMMALRSSFSLLIQIPFFIAAYNYLSNLKALDGSSFYFIKNLGLPDGAFTIGSITVNALPILMTIINCLSGIIYSKGHGKGEKIQIFSCAFIFLILLYNSPSGLVLYWTMNNIFSFIKNIFYKVKNPKKAIYKCLFAIGTLGIISVFTIHRLSTQKTIYKLFIIFCSAILILIPYIIKFCKKLSTKFIQDIGTDKKLRKIVYILSFVSLTLLTGLFIPSHLIESEVEQFCYIDSYTSPFPFVIITFLKSCGLFCIWLSVFYCLFSDKVKNNITFLTVFTAFMFLLNTFVFSGKYGPIQPSLIFMQPLDHTANKAFLIISSISVLGLFVLTLVFFKKHLRLISYLLGITIFSLCFVSIKNIVTIQSFYKRMAPPQTYDTIEPIYHISKNKKNVIVIMQDRAMPSYFQEFLEERPDLYNSYDGFTFYPNCVSFGNCTMTGTPGIFGGYDYTPYETNLITEKTMRQKRNEAILTMPDLFLRNGFDVTVSDIPYENFLTYPISDMYKDYPEIHRIQALGAYTDFWYKKHNIVRNEILSMRIKRNFIFFSIFKGLPPILRPILYRGEYWVSSEAFDNFQSFIDSYSVIDYMKDLVGTDADKSAFLMLVNNAVHEPIYLQYPNYEPQEHVTDIGTGRRSSDTEYHAMAGTFLKYIDFFEYLKKNDCWDNTKIIIVSDHGVSYETGNYDNSGLPFVIEDYMSFLLVKDFGAKGKLNIDYTFMTNADTPYLATKNIIENAQNPFTGKPLKVDDKNPLMKLDMGPPVSTRIRNKTKYPVADDEWWGVKDNVFINSNWYQWNFKTSD